MEATAKNWAGLGPVGVEAAVGSSKKRAGEGELGSHWGEETLGAVRQCLMQDLLRSRGGSTRLVCVDVGVDVGKRAGPSSSSQPGVQASGCAVGLHSSSSSASSSNASSSSSSSSISKASGESSPDRAEPSAVLDDSSHSAMLQQSDADSNDEFLRCVRGCAGMHGVRLH